MNRLMRSGIVAALFVLIVLATQAQTSRLQAAPTNSTALTAVVQPPCTETEFNTAFNVIQTSGGGTITFNCGGPKTILVLSLKNVTQNTIIDGGGVITITGGLATPLFHVTAPASLSMSDIILDSANNTNSSGGAIWSSGPLTLTNVTIQHSQAGLPPSQYCGGALLVAGDTYITHSTFDSNVAILGGGAICVRSQIGTKVQIVDSSFYSNRAIDTTNGLGGALYVEYGTADVLDSIFLFNSAHFGGAVYALGNAAVTLEGSATSTPPFASHLQFNANSATEDGGAIYNNAGAMTIKNAVVSVNQTPTQTVLAGYGGGIHNEGVLTLTNSIISSNQGRYGGGAFVGGNNGARAVIDRAFFYNNVSGNLGGGLYTNIVTTSITISNSAFSGNTAATGGGLARYNASLNIYNSSFTNNTAAAGGGLFLGAVPDSTSGPYVRVQSVTVSGNTATGASNPGGGVYNNGRVELYSMTIVTNTNGVYSDHNGNTRFRDTVLQNPGFLNCDGDGSAQISDDTKNFSADNSCVLPGSQTGTGLDPKLGPLALDPTGGTSYYLPLAGSPLTDAGFNCPEYDQRGASRVGACDIGAVEYIPPIYLPLVLK